jgi:hypothetical protein
MVAGAWIVTDGAVDGLDVGALRRAHQTAAHRVQTGS